MIYRVQFWARYRGRVNVITHTAAGSADQLAEVAVQDAILAFNAKWPGTHRDELHCVGAEPVAPTPETHHER